MTIMTFAKIRKTIMLFVSILTLNTSNGQDAKKEREKEKAAQK